MNKEELTKKIMSGLSNSLNESKAFDPKNNKDHREAYNSFVKWYNRWKEKLGREEIRGLVRKVTNDALGDNLDKINESGYNIKLNDGTSIYHSDPSSQIKDLKTNGKVWIAIKGTNDKATRVFQKDNQEFLNTCKKLGLQVSGNVERKDINGNIHKLYTLNESGIPGPEDDHLAFDLFLTFQNTRELRDLSQPMVNNLIKRLRKGEELSIDILASSSIVEKYAKATIEEYKRTVYDAPSFVNTSTRKNLKRRIAQDLIDDAKDDYAFELHDM